MLTIGHLAPGVNPLAAGFDFLPPPDLLAFACDWCAGHGCIPTEGGELLPCPECDPNGEERR